MNEEKKIACPCCGQDVEGATYLADPVTCTVTNGTDTVHLTKQQLGVVKSLLSVFPGGATKERLYNDAFLYPNGEGPDIKIVDVQICKIRPKLAAIGLLIETIWGSGYKLVAGSPEQAAGIKDAGIRFREKGSAHRWRPEYDVVLADLMKRRFSMTQCATKMKLPYVTVERAWKRLEAATNA